MVSLPIAFGVAAWLLGVAGSGPGERGGCGTLTERFSKVGPSSPEWSWFERAWLTTTRLRKLARRTLPEPFASCLREQAEAVRALYREARFGRGYALRPAGYRPVRQDGRRLRPCRPRLLLRVGSLSIMTVAYPISHAWITTGGTGARNYDEFADDAEITAVIAANPRSALAVEMPHLAPESLGASFMESLPGVHSGVGCACGSRTPR
jgi:hypothetical protein